MFSLFQRPQQARVALIWCLRGGGRAKIAIINLVGLFVKIIFLRGLNAKKALFIIYFILLCFVQIRWFDRAEFITKIATRLTQ